MGEIPSFFSSPILPQKDYTRAIQPCCPVYLGRNFETCPESFLWPWAQIVCFSLVVMSIRANTTWSRWHYAGVKAGYVRSESGLGCLPSLNRSNYTHLFDSVTESILCHRSAFHFFKKCSSLCLPDNLLSVNWAYINAELSCWSCSRLGTTSERWWLAPFMSVACWLLMADDENSNAPV